MDTPFESLRHDLRDEINELEALTFELEVVEPADNTVSILMCSSTSCTSYCSTSL
jgi:hypothetical protein